MNNLRCCVAVALACVLCVGTAHAQKKPDDKPASGKPKFSAPSSPPQRPESKPQPTKPPESKPKFTAPSAPPPERHSTTPGVHTPSAPPSRDGMSDKARAAAEARSERKFQESQKAVQPPVSAYKTPDGKKVEVRTATADAQKIRSMPSSSVRPEVRQKNIEVHVTHHYPHDYGWYRSQPPVYVGGGYSSAFWWMMMEWDADRRARWLYNHRYDIDADAYSRAVRDAEVARRIERLESSRPYRDPNYVDNEFRADPSLQYDDDYVHAVYNPAPVTPLDPGAALAVLAVLGSVVLLGVLCWGFYALFFKVRF